MHLTNDRFSWFKDGAAIPGAEELTYSVVNAALQDSSYYNCQITNTLFPDLTLFSNTSWLHVQIPLSIELLKDQKISIYPNPANQRIYIDTKNENANVKIFNLSGILVFDKNNFSSGWVNIHSFTSGIYFFRIKNINNEIINKRVIFK